MHAIEISELRKSYGSKEVLHGISFDVPPGRLVGFLGPNGAGKTTTIRVLMGLIHSSGGEARLFGRSSASDGTQLRKRVGYLPGETRLYPTLTGQSLLSFLARVRGVNCRAEIKRLAEVFDLDLRPRIRQYSSGMKQKLGLIQALMHRPELLVLDEPTAALDPLVRHALFAELRRVAQENRTVLFSSHTLSEVAELCDQVIMLRAGKIVENQTLGELRLQAVRRVEAIFPNVDRIPKSLPNSLQLLERNDRKWVFTWTSDVQSLLRWLESCGLADVAIGKPSLEELFLTYYRD